MLHMIGKLVTVPDLHFNTLVLLGCWLLWKRRNRLIFDGVAMSMREFLASMRSEADLWRQRIKVEERWVVDQWCVILVSNM